MQAWKGSVARALVVGLKLLNALMEDRIERTRRVVIAMRLVHRRKDDRELQDYERDRRTVEQEAKAQVALTNACEHQVLLESVCCGYRRQHRRSVCTPGDAGGIDNRARVVHAAEAGRGLGVTL
jgi:hypothetical protein